MYFAIPLEFKADQATNTRGSYGFAGKAGT